MMFSFKGLFYRILIDPLISGIRKSIVKNIEHSATVVDIACGTGALAFYLADSAVEVTAIDLDEDLISYASQRAAKKGIRNIRFEARDASDLSMYRDRQFDIAVTSMSVHQFEAALAVKILSEMKRIASKVIIADYNHPLPGNFEGKVAGGIERLAGGDHYRNFSNYMASGGLKHFTDAAGLVVVSEVTRGNGVFRVVVTT